MIYILLTILATTTVILIFKVFERLGVRSFRAIIVNYFVCVLFGLLFTPIDFAMFNGGWLEPWFLVGCILGICFIGGFYSMSLAVKYSGVTVATVASKNSIIISATIAIFLFHETVDIFKLSGIGLAILAIVLVSVRSKNVSQEIKMGSFYLFPAIVLVVSGIIELLLKIAEEWYLPPAYFTGFFVLIFGIAGLIGLLILFAQYAYNKSKMISSKSENQYFELTLLNRKDFLAGISLGLPNYATIYLLMKSLHLENWESSVIYPVLNIGVVVLSSALALFIFKEKLSKINLIGVAIAVVAILLIAQSGN